MKIDIEKLNDLVEKSGDIFLSPDGEKALVKLLDIQEQVDQAITKAKEILEIKALAIDPNFTAIVGDEVKVSYRYYGAKYYIEDDKVDQVPVDLYKVTKRYSVKTKELEQYIEEKNGIPVGIREVERKKALNFKKRGEK